MSAKWLGKTLGPTVVFQKAPPTANASPYASYQFFGEVNIDAQSQALTVDLIDLNGASQFRRTARLGGRTSIAWLTRFNPMAVGLGVARRWRADPSDGSSVTGSSTSSRPRARVQVQSPR